MTTTGIGAIIAKAEHHIDKTTHHQTTTEPGHNLDSVTTSLQAQYNRKHHYQRTSHQATTGIGIIIDNFAASLLAQQHHDNKRTTYKITIGMLGSSAVIVTTQIYAKNIISKGNPARSITGIGTKGMPNSSNNVKDSQFFGITQMSVHINKDCTAVCDALLKLNGMDKRVHYCPPYD